MSGNLPPSTYTITLVPPVMSLTPGLQCRGSGPFAGMPQANLQQALFTAQTALINVATGTSIVNVSYGEGQGHRQATYNRANVDQLRLLIVDLQRALGMSRQRAIGFRELMR